ncbi:hypothetical protein NDU88_002780 [Pleurodeles waltl]|uniref:Uncharacterized protein n=1 Tax=Pleurodeles waltl TaxID=8319 RepID=A0AAV7T3I1_PLEWA|nr:hypothetical protein NDU88_002780 [Pleurodeles waltl]
MSRTSAACRLRPLRRPPLRSRVFWCASSAAVPTALPTAVLRNGVAKEQSPTESCRFLKQGPRPGLMSSPDCESTRGGSTLLQWDDRRVWEWRCKKRERPSGKAFKRY